MTYSAGRIPAGCNCANLCRPNGMWENDAQGVGCWPAPTHVEGCALHHKELFKVVTYDGTSVTVPASEVDEIILGAEGFDYRVEQVWLTRDQFDAMPEFGGF